MKHIYVSWASPRKRFLWASPPKIISWASPWKKVSWASPWGPMGCSENPQPSKFSGVDKVDSDGTVCSDVPATISTISTHLWTLSKPLTTPLVWTLKVWTVRKGSDPPPPPKSLDTWFQKVWKKTHGPRHGQGPKWSWIWVSRGLITILWLVVLLLGQP